jgi:hypothetical protein
MFLVVDITIKALAKVRNGNITLGKGACGIGEMKFISASANIFGRFKRPTRAHIAFKRTAGEEN